MRHVASSQRLPLCGDLVINPYDADFLRKAGAVCECMLRDGHRYVLARSLPAILPRSEIHGRLFVRKIAFYRCLETWGGISV